MKKLLSLFLCLTILFVFAACGGSSNAIKHEVDIEYYAKLGKIPECEFALGANTEDIKSEMEERLSVVESGDHSHGEVAYTFIEGNLTALIDCGNYRYYYYKSQIGGGVSFIASFDNAYGFNMGDSISKIKEVISEFDYKETSLNEDNSFFLNGTPDGVCIEAVFGEHTVNFIFIENELTATTIFDGSQW